MINVFLLTIVWFAIVAVYYYIAKWLTQDLEERRFIDLIASPFIRLQGLRAAKPIEYLGVLLGFVGFVGSVAGYVALFKHLQSYLFHRSEGFFTADDSTLIFTVIILGFGVWLLVFLGINRFGKVAENSKWKQNIEIWEAFHLSHRAKNRGIITALILQFAFVFGMTNYTIIGDNHIQHASFFSIKPTTYALNNVQSAAIYIKTDDDDAYFEFDVVLPDGTIVDLVNNNQELLHHFEGLKQFAQTLEQHDIPISVENIGVLKRGRMKRDMKEEVFEKTLAFLSFFSKVELGINKTFEVGEVATYKNVDYRVDSVLLGKKSTHSLKNRKYIIVYMTIENKRADTLNFYKTISLKLTDTNGTSHISSFTGADELGISEISNKIPPHQSISGAIVYYVPKEKNEFTLTYDFSYVNDHELNFNLGQPRIVQHDKTYPVKTTVIKNPFSYRLDSIVAVHSDYLNLSEKNNHYLLTYWTIQNNSNTTKSISSHHFKLENSDGSERMPSIIFPTWKRPLPKLPRKIDAGNTTSGLLIYKMESETLQDGTITCLVGYSKAAAKFAYTTKDIRRVSKFKPKLHAVGTTVRYDNISYTIHKAWKDDGTYFRQLGKDKAYLMVDISITNHQANDIEFSAFSGLRLDDKSTGKKNQLGHRPISSYIRQEHTKIPESIKPNETVRGHLVYWIPKTSNQFILKTPIEYGDYNQVQFKIQL